MANAITLRGLTRHDDAQPSNAPTGQVTGRPEKLGHLGELADVRALRTRRPEQERLRSVCLRRA
jgi:hypothetical protein